MFWGKWNVLNIYEPFYSVGSERNMSRIDDCRDARSPFSENGNIVFSGAGGWPVKGLVVSVTQGPLGCRSSRVGIGRGSWAFPRIYRRYWIKGMLQEDLFMIPPELRAFSGLSFEGPSRHSNFAKSENTNALFLAP
jgi:hypothetical protein